VVRSGLRGILGSQPDFEVVAEAADGNQAVALARRFRPDVVLMDLRMPGMDGVTATGKIKAEHPEIQIVVLTTYETDADILHAVGKGAIGFMMKDASEENLFDAIRQAAQGRSPLAPSVTTRLVQRMSGTGEERLSKREILQLVAQGLNNKAIAGELLISESTVKAHSSISSASSA
jgi:DNA-binding NarL/FixJ family response regulator